MATYNDSGAADHHDGINEENQFYGGTGNDSLHGNEQYDYIEGGADNDELFGRGGDDYLLGGSGIDTLNGGLGRDTLSGGAGSDVLYGDRDDDLFGFDGGSGGDIDTLYGGDGNDTVYGAYPGETRLANGEAGDDVFFAYTGTEAFNGGRGEDLIYYIYSTGGVTVNLLRGIGSGFDAAGDTYVLVEDVQGSAYGDSIIGNGAYNMLEGGAGNDTIAGQSGSDYLDGGGDSDTLDYTTSNGGVVIDLVEGVGFGAHAEEDQFVGFENVDGSGYNDKLLGTDGTNSLAGSGGADSLRGRDGGDNLAGGAGDDTLWGDLGRDLMSGGAGADRFAFASVADSAVGKTVRDQIFGFNHAEGDLVVLSFIDANTAAAGDQKFSFIGTGAFTGVNGQLHTVNTSSLTVIEGDVNGDKVADFQIELSGNLALVGADFVL